MVIIIKKKKYFVGGYVAAAVVVMLMVMVSRVKAQNSRSNSNSTVMTTVVDVGLVLDMKTTFGQMGVSTVKVALSDFYASHPHFTTRIQIHARDSDSDIVTAAASALDLIKNVKVQAIIGPQTSMQANFVTNLGNKAHVPIITFSAKSPTLASLRSPFFFRVAANDSSQVGAIAAVVKAFGWRQVVPIYVDNDYGEGPIPYLTDALQSVDVRVPYRSVISPTATTDQITVELYKLMTMTTRVFVVHMLPDLGAQIFATAARIGMMAKGYVWIVTDGIADFFDSQNTTVLDTMQGVLGVKTVVQRTPKLENFAVRWRAEFRKENPSVVDIPPLVVFGVWAYDAVFALATAVEQASRNMTFGSTTTTSDRNSQNSTELGSVPVSQSGSRLADVLSAVRFKGLSGNFSLVNGQLQTPDFEIVNVNGSGKRTLGFWTSKTGLSKTLWRSDKTTTYSAKNTSLGPIIWPGESPHPPKGWQIPTNGKHLLVGIPVKDGFQEFVNVSFPFPNDTASGYCIDVFKAVLSVMPYAVPFEFVPFAMENGTSLGSYSDLTGQVANGTFDAVVGDVTIRADRSIHVDFTLPYTESGVTMIVPVKDYQSKNAWVFLKPLTWDLWVTSCCFFVFIGFIVWFLEHRINKDFRGPPTHQIGTSLWYSFSTMVFGHREKVVSNWARFVVIIWCFVVLILTQSYTASLTSLLTVQQLRPTISDVNQLIKNRDSVGYQRGSFVLGLLKQMGFEDSQLKIFNSPEELFNLFVNGTTKGGISAAFDETPYMKLFLAKYCSKFTMAEPTFKADGFAFVFPKGSPLVPDVSRAILQVTEGKKMKDIEAVWFQREPSCPDPSNNFSSESLGMESFWGLFLIAGLASVLGLVFTLGIFLYEERATLARPGSVWVNVIDVLRKFNGFDERSPTIRRNDAGDRSTIVNGSVRQTIGVVSMSPRQPRDTSLSAEHDYTSPEIREQGPSSAVSHHGTTSPDGAQTSHEVETSHEVGERVSSVELTPQSQPRPHATANE